MQKNNSAIQRIGELILAYKKPSSFMRLLEENKMNFKLEQYIPNEQNVAKSQKTSLEIMKSSGS